MKKSESLRQLALGDRKLSWLGSFADEMQRLEEENERLMRDVEKFTGVGRMYESEITRLKNAPVEVQMIGLAEKRHCPAGRTAQGRAGASRDPGCKEGVRYR